MKANKSNITKRSDLNRGISSTENDQNLQEIINVIDDVIDLEGSLGDKEDNLGIGTNSQYLRGDKTWATPPNTTYTEITTSEIDAGTSSTLRTISGRRIGYALNKKADKGVLSVPVTNNTGSVINAGVLSYVLGNGNVIPSDINNPPEGVVGLGVVATSLGVGASGEVVIYGKVNNLVTSDPVNTVLWADPDVIGGVTSDKPDDNAVRVGVVSDVNQVFVSVIEDNQDVYDRVRNDVSITFNNVDAMKAANFLKVGDKVRTLGYYDAGDGGGNDYLIVASATGTDDGGSFINLTGIVGQAKGLFVGSVIEPAMFGVRYFGFESVNQKPQYQNFMNFAAGKANYTPACNIGIGSTLDHPNGLQWVLDENAILTTLTAFSPLVRLVAPNTLTTVLVNNVTKGSRTFDVGDVTGVNVGSWVLVGDDFRYRSNQPSNGEIQKVRSISGNTIEIDEGLFSDYNSLNSTVRFFNPYKNCSVTGGDFRGTSPEDDQLVGYDVVRAESFVFNRVKFSNFNRRGIRSRWNPFLEVSNCIFDNILGLGIGGSSRQGYSVEISSGTQWANIHNNKSFGCGKLFDVTGLSTDVGWARFIKCHHNVAYDSDRLAYGTHASGEFIEIYENYAYDSKGDGRATIHTRTPNTEICNNKLFRTGSGGSSNAINARWDGFTKKGFLKINNNYTKDYPAPISVTVSEEDGLTGCPSKIEINDNYGDWIPTSGTSRGISIQASGAATGVIDSIDINENRYMADNVELSGSPCIIQLTASGITVNHVRICNNIFRGGRNDVLLGTNAGVIICRVLSSHLIERLTVLSNDLSGAVTGVRRSTTAIHNFMIANNHFWDLTGASISNFSGDYQQNNHTS
jgi:hypothetical protein